MLRLTLGLIVMASLTACGTETFSACPTLYTYTEGEQDQAADELDAMAPNAVLSRMIGHYAVNRNQIRVCRGEKPT